MEVVDTRWLLFLLVSLMLTPATLASADDEVDDEDDEDDEAQVLGLDAEGLGEVAQWLMVGTLLIVVWLSLIHISSPRDATLSRMPSSA